MQKAEKFGRLTGEESHRRQEIDDGLCNPIRLGRADDRAGRELAADERARFRHNEIRLEILAAERRRVQVREVTDTPVTGSTAVRGGALPALSDHV